MHKKNIQSKCLLDLGYVSASTKEEMFAVCDVYCMPSITEAFGLTYLEAWKYKKPVIAADIPVMNELIRRKKSGLLVEYGDIEMLIKAIKKLMKAKKISNSLGTNGYNSINKDYSYESIINQYHKLFSN